MNIFYRALILMFFHCLSYTEINAQEHYTLYPHLKTIDSQLFQHPQSLIVPIRKYSCTNDSLNIDFINLIELKNNEFSNYSFKQFDDSIVSKIYSKKYINVKTKSIYSLVISSNEYHSLSSDQLFNKYFSEGIYVFDGESINTRNIWVAILVLFDNHFNIFQGDGINQIDVSKEWSDEEFERRKIKFGKTIVINSQNGNQEFKKKTINKKVFNERNLTFSEFEMINIDNYSIGKYEVTQLQWRIIMGNNPSFNHECDYCPVENVSWNDIQSFLKKLNMQTGKNYRLPTEAEWVYAARGGSISKKYKFCGSDNLDSVAWFANNSGHETHIVGKKQPNELGIYDMSGNVSEWCNDKYDANFKDRIIIGGSFFNTPAGQEVLGNQFHLKPGQKGEAIGFRLAINN